MEKVKITLGTIVSTLVLVSVFTLAYFSIKIVLLGIVGIGLGVLIAPAFDRLQKKFNAPRALCAVIVMAGFLLIFSAIAWSLYYLLAGQIESLAQRSPEIISRLDEFASKIFQKFPWFKEQVDALEFGPTAQRSILQIFAGFKIGITAIGGAVFAVIIGIYTALYIEDYYAYTIQAIPPKYRPKSEVIFGKSSKVLRAWFKAQLIDMAIIGTLTAVGLMICQVDYWAVFGFLTAVMGIIPYVGILIVVLSAMLITLASDPGQLPWVILVFTITQQLEGHVIIPLIMKDKVKLPVVPLLMFMLFLGNFFGVIGILLSPPLFAIIKIIYGDIYIPYIEGQKISA